MSIENAVLELAAAIRHLADSNREIASAAPIGCAQGDDHMLTAAALRDKKAAEIKGTKQAEAAKNQEKIEAERELEKSVTNVEAAAKNAASAAGTATAAADTQTTAGAADTATAEAQTSYDYAKDVQPLLVKVGKNRDQLVALLKSFGAAKGADIKPADYAAVIAKANELIAG